MKLEYHLNISKELLCSNLGSFFIIEPRFRAKTLAVKGAKFSLEAYWRYTGRTWAVHEMKFSTHN